MRRRSALAAVSVLLAITCGCVQQTPPHAREMLDSAAAALDRGDWDIAARQAGAFLSGYRRDRAAGEAHYIRGMARLGLGDNQAGGADLVEAVARSQGRIRGLAAAALAEMDWQAGDMELAERYFLVAVASLDDEEAVVLEARCRLGELYQRQGMWEEADLHLDRVIHHTREGPMHNWAMSRVRARAWCIQAGSHDSPSAARAAADELTRAHLPATVRAVVEGGRLRHLVQVGRYQTYDEALSALPAAQAHAEAAMVTVTR